MKSMKFNPGVASKRREKDIMKLKMSNYKVTQSKENPSDFIIKFPGPKDTLYEGGIWTVHVLLPSEYPFRSPSIGFNNKIYHPNVDEASGSVCLDVINQTWSPMYDLVNIFDSFLPQLLNYPNPTDPLNPDAAAVMLKDEKTYADKVKEYVQKYAQEHLKQDLQQTQSQSTSQQSQQSTCSGSNTDGESTEEFQSSNEKVRKQSHQVFADLHENFEEEDNISNISLDNLSELSEVSNLEIEELNY